MADWTIAARACRGGRGPVWCTPRMPSLSQILGEISPLLLLDAASARIQVGLLRADASARWASRMEGAGTGVFACLEELDVAIDAVGAFAFCEGPGSILGVRTSAMAIRAWNVLRPRPTFSYFGLAVVAEALARPGLSVIADARRGQWHRYTLGQDACPRSLGRAVRRPRDPRGFPALDPLPAGTDVSPYDLASLLALPSVAGADLLREAPEPDAFLHRAPEYLKWVPQIHRAP